MFKKLMITTALLMCAANVKAMDLNLSLGNDMKTNKNSLHVAYQKCVWDGKISKIDCTGIKINGLHPEYIEDFFARLKKNFISYQPDGSDKSYMDLGYIKNGANVYPASCQKIIFRPVMNIVITEAGCVIS